MLADTGQQLVARASNPKHRQHLDHSSSLAAPKNRQTKHEAGPVYTSSSLPQSNGPPAANTHMRDPPPNPTTPGCHHTPC